MNNEKQFVEGMFVNEPHEKAPDFIKGELAFNVDGFKEWLDANAEHAVKGVIRVTIKESKAGRKYAEINTWKPNQQNPNTPPVQKSTVDPESFNSQSPDESVDVNSIPF